MSRCGHDAMFDNLLTGFLVESDQLIDCLNSNMLDLEAWVHTLEEGERARCDDELMNELFRATHSFKRLSGMLGLADIHRLTHSVENVFDAARNDQLQLCNRSVETVFQSLDRLERMVASLKDESLPAVGCEEAIDAIQGVLEEAGIENEQASQADAESVIVDDPSAETRDLVSGAPDRAGGRREARQEPDFSAQNRAQSLERWEEKDLFGKIEDETDVPSKYLSIFVDEADLSLDELSETLESLSFPVDRDELQSLLVTAHRLKGSAASVGLHRPAKLSHLMEDVLQDARDRDGPIDEAIAAAMIQCVDGLREYVDGLSKGCAESNEFNAFANTLMKACHFASLARGNLNDGAPPVEPLASATAPAPDPVQNTSDLDHAPLQSKSGDIGADIKTEFRHQFAADQPSGARGVLGRVRFRPNTGMPGMKAQLLLKKLKQVGQVVACDPTEKDLAEAETLEEFEFALSGDVDEGAIRKLLEIGGVESVVVDRWAVAAEQGVPVSPPAANQNTASTLTSTPAPEPPVYLEKPAQVTVVRSPARAPKESAKKRATRSQGKENARPAETLRVEIDRLDQLMNLAGQLVINKARFSEIGERLKQQTSGKRAVQLAKNAQGTVRRAMSGMESTQGADCPEARFDDMLGHFRRLEHDLNAIAQEFVGLNSVRASVTDLNETIDQLDRVADGIQKSVMDTRMVPVGPLFNRFKRVIRDITRENGKAIDLVLCGEKTELDKRMIDELGDPLIHLVRNSVDHGIETPEEREALGKMPRGTVTLNAFHRGNSIVIEVTDDGKGIDAAKVRKKAIDRGVISPADAERMSNHQLFQLIWNAGFSTAEQVTDVSGRGMGMDIVRAKIEELNGHVELDSRPGVGTVFSIRLPLTLAIMPSLMARIDGDVIAMPLETVVEIVNVSRADFTTVQGALTARVRGRVLSVADLAETFLWNRPGPTERYEQRKEEEEVTLVVVSEQSQELGLIVDDLLGEEDIVIKSMSENYRNVEGVAGASILGDGRVALILDVAATIQMAMQSVARSFNS